MLRFVVLLLVMALSLAARAQRHPTDLSEIEEEKVRDAAVSPALRIAVYQEIIETRIKRIQAVLADARAQGRREDIQHAMEEISGLVDELQDNLEEYADAHRDLRKQLPKLQNAMERWVSVLKQAPADASYDLTRKLALEAVADVQAEAKELLPVQVAYFKEHPPNPDANPGGVGEIARPR